MFVFVTRATNLKFWIGNKKNVLNNDFVSFITLRKPYSLSANKALKL